MPIYEYYCATCDDIFEHFEKHLHPNFPFKCDKCDTLSSHRVLSVFSSRVAEDHENLKKNTGCKGFECVTPDGTKVPMYNKHTA